MIAPAATTTTTTAAATRPAPRAVPVLVVGLIAFLTVVDLFATQAILPALREHYGVSAAAMGSAVNASTLGMAVSGLLISLFSQKIDRRAGVVASLVLLALPTALLAHAPDLGTFALLRVAQGLCMAAAFTLTLAYLGESLTATQAASAFAAYITGNVASNLVGRLVSAGVADHLGLTANFYAFAALNLAGAALAAVSLSGCRPVAPDMARNPFAVWADHLSNPALRASFAIGFCILFAFIGTFTYVNFVLVSPPLSLDRMWLGFVYVVFLPSILTTPLAGRAVDRFGVRRTVRGALGLALIGIPLLLAPALALVLAGMVLVAVGTFFAQAAVTGFVSRAARTDRGAASGLYLASYFAGGMVGSAVLGAVFDRSGWMACAGGIMAVLAIAMVVARGLQKPPMTG